MKRRPSPARHGALALLGLGVVLLHSLALGAWPQHAARDALPSAALQVRQIEIATPPPAQEAVQAVPPAPGMALASPATSESAAPAPAMPRAPARREAPKRAAANPKPSVSAYAKEGAPAAAATAATSVDLAPVQVAGEVETTHAAPQSDAAALPEPAMSPEPAALPESAARPRAEPPLQLAQARIDDAAASAASPPELPVYATRLPPPYRYSYELRRGMLSGKGELRWAPSADARRYEAQLTGSVAGLRVLDWKSEGAIDKHGVAPTRYVVTRLGRNAQAANFQRSSNRITYSGPQDEFPLVPGTQDRLTILMQLAGIVAAAPQRFTAGQHITMFVTGARGDAGVWQFNVLGPQTIDIGGAPLRTLHVLREPRKPRDSRLEAWLDPARHYAPAKARMSNEGADASDALDLLLQPD